VPAPITASGLSAALAEWTEALGSAHVSVDPGALRDAATATFPTASTISAILSPGTREEVQRSVIIANRHRIPLSPISTGKNWGYGSSAPVLDGVLLDLGRLDRIVDFSEELAYVTIEPGVTQRQLYDFLQAQRSDLWMDATGASPDCSVIGNTLERGFGHTPMGDHAGSACGLQVVLPDGACIETGFCRFPKSKVGAVARNGLGPSFDGLFFQSNLGIVTRMSIWLMPAPEYFQAFFLQTEGTIGPLVDALRPLRLNGTIRNVMHIGNDFKVLSGSGEYPWKESRGHTPLDRPTMDKLRAEIGFGRWNASGAIYGTRVQVREARSLLRRALGGIARLQFVDDGRIDFIRLIEPSYRFVTRRQDLRRALKLLPPLIQLLKGVPTDCFLASAYWRKKGGIPDDKNPDRDRCGLLWCSPVAPNTGKAVEELTALASDRLVEHGFEPLISVSLLTERATVSTVAITYDRDVPGEDQRAVRCYRALVEELLRGGYPPYRLSIGSMEYADTGGPYGNMMQSIKRTLDPNGILSPGHYLPSDR